MFNQFKQDMNIFQENKNKKINEMWKSIQDMKTEFINEIELLKGRQTEKMLEIKISTSQIQISVENLSNRKDHVGNRISVLEDSVEKASVDKSARRGTGIKTWSQNGSHKPGHTRPCQLRQRMEYSLWKEKSS